MSLYLRGYPDFSFEIIFTDGKLKKKRIHLLINPHKQIKIAGAGKESEVELNPQSLTHIVSISVSQNDEFLKKTIKIAELTNKPVIADNFTSDQLKKLGLSVRQIRIIGFDDQVIDGLKINPILYSKEDPVSSDSLNEMEKPIESVSDKPKPKFGISLLPIISTVSKGVNKLAVKPLVKVKQTILKKNKPEDLDSSKPHLILLQFRKNIKVLLPLDKFGLSSLSSVLEEIKNCYVIFPGVEIDDNVEIKAKNNTVVVLNKNYSKEDLMVIPMRYNPKSDHNTLYGGFMNWLQLDEFSF